MNYQNVTFVFALPRSRTAWLAWCLDMFGIDAMRDPLKQCESIEELHEKIDMRVNDQPDSALVVIDTAFMFFTDKIMETFPGARYVVIYRNQFDVRESLRRKGVFNLHLAIKQEGLFGQALLRLSENSKSYLIQYKDMSEGSYGFDMLNHIVRGTTRTLGAGATAHYLECCRHYVDIPIHVQAREIDRVKTAKLFHGLLPSN